MITEPTTIVTERVYFDFTHHDGYVYLRQAAGSITLPPGSILPTQASNCFFWFRSKLDDGYFGVLTGFNNLSDYIRFDLSRIEFKLNPIPHRIPFISADTYFGKSFIATNSLILAQQPITIRCNYLSTVNSPGQNFLLNAGRPLQTAEVRQNWYYTTKDLGIFKFKIDGFNSIISYNVDFAFYTVEWM